MSGAVAADRPGPRSEPPGTAELLCALSYGSGLAAAEQMEHGTNTAFVGVQLGRALGAGAGDLEAVFYRALVKDAGCGACGAVLARFFADDEMVPRLDLNLVDLHSPRSMAAWAGSRLRPDPGLPARLARLAAFAARCGPVVHEAMAVHCEVAADFAAGLGFGPHVRDAVHYQYERHDGRSPAFGRPAEMIPRPAQILHLALAADLVRGLSGTGAAAVMVRRRTGTYFDPDVAGAYLDLAGGLWPDGDEPVPLTDVLGCAPGTPVDELPGDRRLAVCEALADFADLKSARRGSHSHRVAGLAARAACGLGLPAAEQERLRRAGLVHDLGTIAVPPGCWSRQATTQARPAAGPQQPRSPSRSGCTPTTRSASCPGSAPSPTWPPTSAATTSASTAQAIRSGSPARAYPPAPGCSPPPMPGPSGPATARPTSPVTPAWTRHASPRCGPAPGPVPVPRASAPAPTRAAPPSAHASWRSSGCSPTAPPTPTSARPCTSAGAPPSTTSSTSSPNST